MQEKYEKVEKILHAPFWELRQWCGGLNQIGLKVGSEVSRREPLKKEEVLNLVQMITWWPGRKWAWLRSSTPCNQERLVVEC